MRAAIAPTSLPDTTVDPALRRLLAPTGRFVRKATADRPAAAAVAGRFVDKLAAGSMAVDPTDFVPAGVLPPSAEPPPPPPPPEQRLTLKADLRAVGLITTRHADLVRANGEVFVVGRQVDPLLQLRAVATTGPAPASGFVLGKLVGGGLGVEFIDRTMGGNLVVRTAATEPNEVVVRVTGALSMELGRDLVLPPDAVRPGRPPIDVLLPPGGGDVVIGRPPIERPPIEPPIERPPIEPPIERPPIEPPIGRAEIFEGPTVTVPPLVRDALVLNRFEAAIAQIAEVGALADATPDASTSPMPSPPPPSR